MSLLLLLSSFRHPRSHPSIPDSSTKSRRSSCDTPDQQQHSPYGGGGCSASTTSGGTDQATVTSSISGTTTTTTSSAAEGDDDFDSPSTIKYKLIANVATGSYQRTTTSSSSTGNAGGRGGGGVATAATKSQVNIITNPLVRQYPFETNFKTKRMYANETIVTQQPGGNLKTISYGGGGGTSSAAAATVGSITTGGAVDLKKSPLVNRRRSSSVTLPQPPTMSDRYIKAGENNSNIFDGGGASKADCRNSR